MTNASTEKNSWGRLLMAGIAIFVLCLLTLTGCSSNANEVRKSSPATINDVASKIAELPVSGFYLSATGVGFSPDGKQIAVVAEPRVVKVWDWESRHLVTTLEKAEGSQQNFTPHEVIYSHDGKLLVSCDDAGVNDEFIRFWNTLDWRISGSLYDKKLPRHGCQDMAFSPDSNEFYYIENHSWNPAELVSTSTRTWVHNWTVKIRDLKLGAFAIDPTGKFIAIVGWRFDLHPTPKSENEEPKKSMSLLLVDAASHAVVKTIAVKMFELENYESVAWSPDGKRFAISGGGHLQIFSADGEILEVSAWGGAVHSRVIYSADGKYFLEWDSNGQGTGMGLRIWDADHQRLLQSISGNVTSLSVSKDSKYLALGRLNKTSVWQLK